MGFNYKKYTEILEVIEKKSIHLANKPKIVAISKNHTVSSIKMALDKGIRVFGENRVQEAVVKFTDLKKKNDDIELHLTGPLQTNKVKSALSIFDIFQTLDREKLAIEFKKHISVSSNKKFFIQINTGMEEQKAGIFPSASSDFIDYCRRDLSLSIIGLMCIPPIKDDPIKHFDELRNIAQNKDLQFLSMGMSDDYEKALTSGATHLRIGTLLFGNR